MSKQVLYYYHNFNKKFQSEISEFIPGAVLTLNASSYSVNENTTFSFTVFRTVKTDQAITFDATLSGGSFGTFVSHSAFAAGETQKTIQFNIPLVTATSIGTLVLSAPAYSSGPDPDATPSIGTPGSATVTVNNTVGIGGRDSKAGLWALWGNFTTPIYDIPYVKGVFAPPTVNAIWSTGNYSPASGGNYYGYDKYWAYLDGTAQGEKGMIMQLSDKKDTDWQKHVWYAEDAKSLYSAIKNETPDWVGAWWTADGIDVMKGIFDGMVYYYNNLSANQRGRILGLRANYNAISGEGEDVGPVLSDTNHSAWTKGSLASATRPPDFDNNQEDAALSAITEYQIDQALPDGDGGSPLFTLFTRAKNGYTLSSSTNNRVKNLWYANKIGIMITSAEHEPRSSAHEGNIGMAGLRDACKDNGLRYSFTEPFGEDTDDSDLKTHFTMLQFQYWMSLQCLSVGVSYISWRMQYLLNYDLVGDNTLRDEWRASMAFIDKYAGYMQLPDLSPGAWVALREGNRNKGNYDFLATQVITGAGDRGTELFAGSEGAKFPFPAVGGSGNHVGPGSYTVPDPTGGSDAGAGQRQSIWAFQFSTSQKLKVALDSSFVASLSNTSIFYVNVTYLDDSASGEFDVIVFGVNEGTVLVNNTGNWITASIPITGFTVDANGDSDGAHVEIDVTTGPVRFHMVEVSKT